MYRHLLVPLDTTDLSIQVVSNAVGLARPLGARITFFHAEQERKDVTDVDRGEADWGTRELLAKAEAGARALGVPCGSRSTRGRTPAAAIVATARELGCDLIFMATHGHGGKLGMAMSSETLEVLASAGMPVLVASSGEPKPLEHAIAVVRDEHRAIAAVIHEVMSLLARARSTSVHDGVLRAAVTYLHGFPSTQHHPKEEQHLFARLRARTRTFDAELDELERQHVRDRALLAELSDKLDALERAAAPVDRLAAAAELEIAFARYAELHWEHMGREETVILPAAQLHLLPDDWDAINAVFDTPRWRTPHAPSGLDYHDLFARVVEGSRR